VPPDGRQRELARIVRCGPGTYRVRFSERLRRESCLETATLSGLGQTRANLLGDRHIEWSWTVASTPPGPGNALDFGNGGGPLALAAALDGYNVTAVDLTAVRWPYVHPNLRFMQGDILSLNFQSESFDLILNCSSVEHVGLAGRYGIVTDDSEGDLKAMRRLLELLKPGGHMILTIPMGKDAVFEPLCRIYGETRLRGPYCSR
jgi:2-polyprenyl-3-methyl-5-hydroxy-6-metoxy-1,4-benzoquinol methylase